MSVYYPTGCDDLVPAHYCDSCESPELGRIRSVAFIKNTLTFSDPSSPTEWEAGFASGEIFLIPFTNGTYDGGAEVESPGYGDQATRITGYNFQVTYNDPNYRNNCDFYNALKDSRQYKFAFRTETQIHLTDTTVSVIPKNPVTDDVNSAVVWSVTVKWAGKELPCPVDVPEGIFDECVSL